jgi:hypothetical protein
MLPKKYGDFQALRLSGPDDGPIQTQKQPKLDMDISALNKIIEESERQGK